MARWIVAGLLILNVVLGIGVALKMEPKAQAQIGKKGGNFATVSGQANGNSIIYILDVNSGGLAALNNDVNNGRITVLAKRNVADDMKRNR